MYDYREQPYQYYNSYPELKKKNMHPILSIFCMFWYLVLIFPVTVSVFFAFWVTSIALALNFIAVWLQRSVFPEAWMQSNWFYQQSDAVVYSMSAGVTIVGILLVWLMFKVTSPFLKMHGAILRGIWG